MISIILGVDVHGELDISPFGICHAPERNSNWQFQLFEFQIIFFIEHCGVTYIITGPVVGMENIVSQW